MLDLGIEVPPRTTHAGQTLCTESADKPLANAHQTKDWVASTTSLMPLIQKCIAGTASTSAVISTAAMEVNPGNA